MDDFIDFSVSSFNGVLRSNWGQNFLHHGIPMSSSVDNRSDPLHLCSLSEIKGLYDTNRHKNVFRAEMKETIMTLNLYV